MHIVYRACLFVRFARKVELLVAVIEYFLFS